MGFRGLRDLAKRDQREHHREDGHGLDDAERREIVGEALVRLSLAVARRSAGASLEERGKADAETREDPETFVLPSMRNIRIIP